MVPDQPGTYRPACAHHASYVALYSPSPHTHRLRVERRFGCSTWKLDDRKRVPLVAADHWRIDVDVRTRLERVPPGEPSQQHTRATLRSYVTSEAYRNCFPPGSTTCRRERRIRGVFWWSDNMNIAPTKCGKAPRLEACYLVVLWHGFDL